MHDLPAAAHIPDPGDQGLIPIHIWIDDSRCAQFERQLAAEPDGLDNNDLPCALNARPLYGAEPDWPRPSTTTTVPGSTGARIIARPKPVVVTHESRDSSAAGKFVEIGIVCSSYAIISSEKLRGFQTPASRLACALPQVREFVSRR